MTTTLDTIRDALPDVARDIKLNLGAVLGGGTLAPEQRWGVAIAAAFAARDAELAQALTAALPAETPAGIAIDAQAAATIMAMTNVFYRFRHLVAKPEYADLPARLRMNRLGQPASTKANLELFSLAVSAMAGCEVCVQAHERVVVDSGLTPDQVADAVRIAATVNALATARAIGRAQS